MNDLSKLSDFDLDVMVYLQEMHDGKFRDKKQLSMMSDDEFGAYENAAARWENQDFQFEQFSGLRSAIEGAGQGLSLGFSEEIEAALRAPFSDQSYSEIRDSVRQRHDQMRDEDPYAFGGGELAGGLAGLALPGGLAAKGVSQGLKASSNVARSAGLGAIEGSIAGAGYSDGENLGEIAKDAAVGAAIGVPLGAGAGLIGDVASTLAKGSKSKTTSDLLKDVGKFDPDEGAVHIKADKLLEGIQKEKAAKKALVKESYDEASRQQGEFLPDAIPTLKQSLDDEISNIPDPVIADRLKGIVDRSIRENGDGSLSLERVEGFRKALNRAYSGLPKTDDALKNEMRSLINKFDDQQLDLIRGDLFSGSEKAIDAFKQARGEASSYYRLSNQDKIIKALSSDDITSDEALNYLFSANKIAKNQSARKAIQQIEKISKESFEALQQSAWIKLTRNRDGTLRNAKDIAKAIDELKWGHAELAKLIFKEDWKRISKLSPLLKKAKDQEAANKWLDPLKERYALGNRAQWVLNGALAAAGFGGASTVYNSIFGN